MRRLLVMCAALAMVSACKKEQETTPPEGATTVGDTAGGEGEEEGEPEVPQEPDPPAIAAARGQVLVADFTPAAEALGPLWVDLKERKQYRASGLAAAWYALAVVHEIAENAHEAADHAVAMAAKTDDPEVVAAAHTAMGVYHLGVEHFDEAREHLEKAYNADREGKNAALAMIYFAEVRIAMAFDGTDQITKPEELDAAATALGKAKELATAQGSEILAGRALVNEAAVERYRNKQDRACELLKEGIAKYEASGASDWLTSGAFALNEAARCK